MRQTCRWTSSPERRIFRTSQLLFVAFLFATLTCACLGHVIHRNDESVVQEHNLPYGEDPDPIVQVRRNKIREMTLHAWNGYKQYAWGKNEVRPVSLQPNGGVFGDNDIGATIVDALDTLYIMNLTDQYRDARDWVEEKFKFKDVDAELSAFETNIRFVGGMLSIYALTGDELFKAKAQEVADTLLPVFRTPTGIPLALVNIRTGRSKNYEWASGSILSELGTFHLEFAYLSDITGNAVYRNSVMNTRQKLNDASKPDGLYPNFIDPNTGDWGQPQISLGAMGDSFYEYLLKAWIQSGKTDSQARQMYDSAMKAIAGHLIQTSPGQLIYASDMNYGRLNNEMGHLTCFAGGLFALGAATQNDENTENFMRIGKGITNTCHESYIRATTRLGPERFGFEAGNEAMSSNGQDRYYILRPEVVESYFILWRLTHDQKYRDWGWDAAQAIEKHLRAAGGFSGIRNVYSSKVQMDDVQQSFFLAETLKYLYLLFSDDSLVPLNEWVFNTEAHPLPIKGKSSYRLRQANP